VGKVMRQIVPDQARHEAFHHKRVDLLEKDVDNLKVRVNKLEKRHGS
jgi:hypothetical protein